MRLVGLGSQEMVRFGASSSQDDQPLAGFEELAMPLFDSLTTSRAGWRTFERCRGSRTRDLSQGFTQFRIVSAWHKFPGMDISNPEEQLPKFVLETRAPLTVAMDSEEDGPELAVDTETPETILMNRFNSQLVQRAIDDLPVHYRETLLLCEVEEMSYQEIAEVLSIPMGTVMSRLARARKAVRESLLSAAGSTPSGDFSVHIEAH